MNSRPRIVYTPHPSATSKAELNALTDVYRYILNCYAKKNADDVTCTDGDDAKKGSLKHEVRANTSIP